MFGLRRRVRRLERWQKSPYVTRPISDTHQCYDYFDSFFPCLSNSSKDAKARIQALLDYLGLDMKYEREKTVGGMYVAKKLKKDSPAKEKNPGND